MGVLLACLASASFVILDVLRKLLGRRLSASDIVIGMNGGAALVFLLLTLRFDARRWDLIFLLLGAMEAVTFTVASILYVRAVSLSPLSLTIPYLGFTPVISAAVAFFLIGEVPSRQGLLGIVLVVVGGVALHLDRQLGFLGLLVAPLREPGSWRMLVVAIIWGVTTSIDKIAIAHGSELLLGLFLTAGSALILIIRRVVYSPPVEPEQGQQALHVLAREPYLLLAALVAGVAVTCQYFAYRELLVAYVETIKRAGGLFSVLVGIVFFGEGGGSRRVPAALLMIAGILMIVL